MSIEGKYKEMDLPDSLSSSLMPKTLAGSLTSIRKPFPFGPFVKGSPSIPRTSAGTHISFPRTMAVPSRSLEVPSENITSMYLSPSSALAMELKMRAKNRKERKTARCKNFIFINSYNPFLNLCYNLNLIYL